MQVAVQSVRGFLLEHSGARGRLTSALHVIHDRHHGLSISGSFVDVLDLHDLERLRRRRESLGGTPSSRKRKKRFCGDAMTWVYKCRLFCTQKGAVPRQQMEVK